MNDIIINSEVKDPRYIFWLDDISVLYKDNNYLAFFPITDMTRIEQLNSLTRFCIYYTILIFLFGKDSEYYYFSIILFLFVIVIYYLYKSDITGKYKEIQRNFATDTENLDSQQTTSFSQGATSFAQGTESFDTLSRIGNFADAPSDALNNAFSNVNDGVIIEAGYMDSDNNMHVGQYHAPKEIHTVPLDRLIQYDNNTCKKPARDNPFMNPKTIDYNNGDQPAACNADDEIIKTEIDNKFNMDLYRDVDDLFNIKNSQRQFYTVPNTQIPNDQPGFANWCYKLPSTCKENQEQCLQYDDVRYNSRSYF